MLALRICLLGVVVSGFEFRLLLSGLSCRFLKVAYGHLLFNTIMASFCGQCWIYGFVFWGLEFQGLGLDLCCLGFVLSFLKVACGHLLFNTIMASLCGQCWM